MTDSDQSLDMDEIKVASDAAFGMLEEAIAQLTGALEDWDENGRVLTQMALERVDSLKDPAYGGLRVETARDLAKELDRLPEPREPLVPNVNLLLLALQKALWDLAEQIEQTMRTLVERGTVIDFADAYLTLVKAVFAEFENPDLAKAGGSDEVGAALARARPLSKAMKEPEESYKVCMAAAILAINEVSGALQVAAMLLTDRLNHLVEFLDRTDLPTMDTSVTRGRFVRTFIKAGVSEAAVESLKQIVEAGIEEVVKEIAKPLTFGLSVLYGITEKVREKRKALEEERKNFEQLIKIQVGPGPSDYMWMLRGNFQRGAEEIFELIELIDDFTKRLVEGIAPGPTD